jgi:two-component system chemotaxis sensor kinase CheA
MAKDLNEIIKRLQDIRNNILKQGIGGSQALADAGADLRELAGGLSEEMGGPSRLLGFCAKGLKAVCENSAPDPEHALKEIIASVSIVESYLLNYPDAEGEHRIREAGQRLDKSLNPRPPDKPDPGEHMNSNELPAPSLNDAAALLLQIESGDFYELSRLRKMLALISEDETAESLENIVMAIAHIDDMKDRAQADPDYAIEPADIDLIGHLIEESMISDEMPRAEGPRRISGGGSGQGSEHTDESTDGGDMSDYMPEDADIELISAFIAESSDLITGAEEALLALETNPEDIEAVSTVFRAFHNIKGTSAFFELSLMTSLAHRAETLLSRVRDREIRYAGGYPDLALRSLDMLKEIFRLLQDALGGKPFPKPEGYDELYAILTDPESAGINDKEPIEPSEPGPGKIKELPEEKLPADEIREDADAEEDEADEADEPDMEEYSAKSVPSGEGLSDSPEKHERIPSSRRKAQMVESSVRVPIDRLDRFIDMVGELVVSHSMVAQDDVVNSGKHHDLQKKVSHTTKIVRELQNMSMSMRMIPLKNTFRKMARLVRDLSRKIGKDVTFITEGEDTEIDRNMVDVINDPLVHMVRNALDHGVEMPDVREKNGKPRHGTVFLSAYHSAGNVVVEIKDDGKGLDRDRIIAKAKQSGLIQDENTLSEREIYNIIFEPGFSTAKMVSDVSGRGVGMDVVKRNIESIRGHVEIYSQPGKGTLFKMSLPLTLAIIDGMVVRVGKEKYVIPTISIVRSVQPTPKDISTVLQKGEMLKLQGRLVPLFRIATLFEIENAEQDLNRAIAVIVENEGKQAGLVVDELIGSQQIVIKTLGEMLGDIRGISGSAIMPNGRVGLILDVGGLVRLANNEKEF